jgi:hypothetical protein
MKITTFDKTTIQMIRAELQHAIRDIENRHGIKLTAGRAKFGQKSASITVDMATIDKNGQVVDNEREFLIANLTWLGLKSEHLETGVRIGNDTFKIGGYKRARYAKPFSLVSQTNGKTYVASEDTVRTALGLPRRLKGWTPVS